MSELKKAFLGGYRKKAVDAELAELRQQLAEAENERQRYRHEAETAESRAAALEQTAADWQTKATKLEEKLSLLDAMAQPAPTSAPTAPTAAGDSIFGNIARIYERAYGTGHQIVCDSKESALALLNGLEARFEEIMGASADTIREYESLNRDIQELYAALHRRINDVADSTSHMLKQAKDFYNIYGELEEDVVSARDSAAALLEEYDTQAAEFLGSTSPATAPAAATAAPAETIAAPSAAPVLSGAAANEPEKPVAAETTAEPATETAAALTEEPMAEPAAEPAASKPPIRMVVSSTGKSASEFTQFGRKSRISAEDRSELLRKALLRNGGN